MNDNILLWVWLTSLKGMTASKITSLMDKFDTIEEIYSKKEAKDFKEISLIHQSDINELTNKNTQKASDIINKMNLINGSIITYDSECYPEKLKALPNPPYVLYVRGQLPDLNKRVSIGVVGTRKYSQYGAEVTKKLSYEIAREGIVIISGMARGVDSFAAAAALKAGEKTIAVLGSGVDVIYPPENGELMKAIAQNGAVISEYPPQTQPFKTNFPERNRIIAGLSDGLLVTEAPKGSGALITAKYANEIGKTIFAVPGNVFAHNCVGTNSLIKAGCRVVTHPDDILSEYSYELSISEKSTDKKAVFVDIPKAEKSLKNNNYKVKMHSKKIEKSDIHVKDEKFTDLTGDELKIANILAIEGKMSIDELIRKSKLSATVVNQMLPLMEIEGVIKRVEGNFYIIG